MNQVYYYEYHDFDDLEYWSNRFMNCYPATYPPELWSEKLFYIEDNCHWLIKKLFPKNDILHTKFICRRCGENIMTGHTCKDISKYIKENKLSENIDEQL